MIDKCGRNIAFAADKIRADRKFVLAAATHAGSSILDYVPEHFRDDKEIKLATEQADDEDNLPF
jgi:hypothetical protein